MSDIFLMYGIATGAFVIFTGTYLEFEPKNYSG